MLASHPDLAKITSDTTGSENNSRSQFQVRQNAQFRSPQHLAQPQSAIEAAREQAILGRVPAHLIPALASPNTDIINRKITWTLRFPLPAPAEGDPQTHRFADLALHASGHRSAAALRNALQLATTTAPPDHEPSNARFIRLPDPTNGHNNAIQNPAAPPSAAIIRWLRGGATRVSSRLFPDASTRPYCPEALFLFFSGKLSLPLCAQLIAQHKEDEPAAVSAAKTSFHRAKEADSFTYHRLLVDLPVSPMPDPASPSQAGPGYASPPAAALGVRPRIPSERSRAPREPPVTPYASQQYDHDFPPFTNAIGAPPSTHKGKGKGKLSDRPPLHIPGKKQRQRKIHPQRLRERLRERLRPRLRERIRQRFWKRSRKGQRQRQRKRKGPQITLARYTSLPTAMASHHRAGQRLRHIGAPACPRYKGTSQPTPTTHSPLAAPPFRCTCLAPLPQLSDSIIREHIRRLHHIGAPASPLFYLFNLDLRLSCNIPTSIMLPNTCEWLHHIGAPAPIGLWAGGKKQKTSRLHHIGAPASFFTSRRVASPYRCTHAHAATPIPSSGAQSANTIVS